MNVLHVASTLDRATGGPVTALIGLAGAQRRGGLAPSIITTFKAGDGFDADRSTSLGGVAVKGVGPDLTPWHWHPSLKGELRDAIARSDVVHVHGVWEAIQWFATGIARELRKPYVITPCGMLDPWSLSQKRLKKATYLSLMMRRRLDSASAIHYCSLQESQDVKGLGLKAPVVVRPNGIDGSEFRRLPEKGSFRRQHAALREPAAKFVLFLGRLHPGKGIDVLIDALPHLPDASTHLVVVGPDPLGMRPALTERARALEVGGRVLFVGMLNGPDRIAALADADVFALASHHENFGIAVIEALAAGCPAVVSEHVPLQAEIVRGGVGSSARLEARAFAAALAPWLAPASPRSEVATRCRDFAFREFDWDAIAGQWAREYDRFAGKGANA